ncbi:MAG: hypothetical protein ACRCWQ_01310, partial [Bacilli bacterium]
VVLRLQSLENNCDVEVNGMNEVTVQSHESVLIKLLKSNARTHIVAFLAIDRGEKVPFPWLTFFFGWFVLPYRKMWKQWERVYLPIFILQIILYSILYYFFNPMYESYMNLLIFNWLFSLVYLIIISIRNAKCHYRNVYEQLKYTIFKYNLTEENIDQYIAGHPSYKRIKPALMNVIVLFTFYAIINQGTNKMIDAKVEQVKHEYIEAEKNRIVEQKNIQAILSYVRGYTDYQVGFGTSYSEQLERNYAYFSYQGNSKNKQEIEDKLNPALSIDQIYDEKFQLGEFTTITGEIHSFSFDKTSNLENIFQVNVLDNEGNMWCTYYVVKDGKLPNLNSGEKVKIHGMPLYAGPIQKSINNGELNINEAAHLVISEIFVEGSIL